MTLSQKKPRRQVELWHRSANRKQKAPPLRYLYVVRHGTEPVFKIGHSNQVPTRFGQFGADDLDLDSSLVVAVPSGGKCRAAVSPAKRLETVLLNAAFRFRCAPAYIAKLGVSNGHTEWFDNTAWPHVLCVLAFLGKTPELFGELVPRALTDQEKAAVKLPATGAAIPLRGRHTSSLLGVDPKAVGFRGLPDKLYSGYLALESPQRPQHSRSDGKSFEGSSLRQFMARLSARTVEGIKAASLATGASAAAIQYGAIRWAVQVGWQPTFPD
jgi:hypothetical protein